VVAVLTATSGRYDYHRDELYFRMLRPAWGYVDQPPLTPLLARLAIAVLGDDLWAIRVPATLCVAAAVLFTALTTRELGGGRAAQALTAWGFALAAFPIIVGHLMSTATVDLAVWAAVILFLVRALLRADQRWWLVAGAVVGLSLFNKLLIMLLLIGLGLSLLLVGPRHVLRSPWLWAGVGIALVLGSPNLIYQATHDWPQVRMAGAISTGDGPDSRIQLLPFQLILFGVFLVPIWVAGLVAVLRRQTWRPVRALGVAYLVVLAIVAVSGGQTYYPFGLLAFLFAAGAIPTVDWVARRPGLRRPLVVGAVVVNAGFTALVGLPLLPVDVLGRTPIPAINSNTRDQIGWPVYVGQIASVYDLLSPQDRAKAVIFVGNYGEAGAIDRYGPAYGLPAVYSGHNQLFFNGPPPETATVVLVWSQNADGPARLFGQCQRRAVMDNDVAVDNEEQGSAVWACRDPNGGWAALWPTLQHYS
jgi:4-amino-4-deoxy-L-arabinose transferase-like glycosyltransferase